MSDISYEDYFDIWLKKELAKLCDNGQIIRYESDIYYIPFKTPFGNSILNPNRIEVGEPFTAGDDTCLYYRLCEKISVNSKIVIKTMY